MMPSFLPFSFHMSHQNFPLPTKNKATIHKTKAHPLDLFLLTTKRKASKHPSQPKTLGLEIEAWRCRVINSSLLTGEKTYRLPHSFILLGVCPIAPRTPSTRQPPYMPRYIPIHPSGCFEAARYHRQNAKLHPGFHAPNAYIPLKRHSSAPLHNDALVPPPSQDSSFTSAALFYHQPLNRDTRRREVSQLGFHQPVYSPFFGRA